MMTYSREDLMQSDATMNQMRNAIYHLERFMQRNEVSDIRKRLHIMGQNIARTYIKHWKPINQVDITNIKEFLTTVYKKVLNSSVSIEFNDYEKFLIVKDSDCPLCKYTFEDIQVAGCEIISAMVSEFVRLINQHDDSNSSFVIEPIQITESRTFGNKSCIQLFKYRNRGD